uniref:RNA-binding protein n=1 Tax=Panagrellus redivivus TaxID=6233 RepID=A0A7E4WDY8_PANRE
MEALPQYGVTVQHKKNGTLLCVAPKLAQMDGRKINKERPYTTIFGETIDEQTHACAVQIEPKQVRTAG